MTKTVKVDGMMCNHCEMHVKEALMKLNGVSDVVASHEKGTAEITFDGSASDDAIKKAIEDAGYKYMGTC